MLNHEQGDDIDYEVTQEQLDAVDRMLEELDMDEQLGRVPAAFSIIERFEQRRQQEQQLNGTTREPQDRRNGRAENQDGFEIYSSSSGRDQGRDIDSEDRDEEEDDSQPIGYIPLDQGDDDDAMDEDDDVEVDDIEDIYVQMQSDNEEESTPPRPSRSRNHRDQNQAEEEEDEGDDDGQGYDGYLHRPLQDGTVPVPVIPSAITIELDQIDNQAASEKIPEEDLQTIAQVMNSFSLPVPDWAKSIPEDRWLPKIVQRATDGSKILKGWASNRKAVFEEMRLEREKSLEKTSVGADADQGQKNGKDEEEENKDEPYMIAGFFHPYCNAGGGGERVLWTAIRDVQENYPGVISIVYTGDTDVNKQQILEKVQSSLNIQLDPSRVGFRFLQKRHWIEGAMWPRFTLIGQSFGSMILGWEALRLVVPDIWIDTMGYAFTYPAVRLFGGCQVAAYVHYPTISSDMIGRVASRESAHNNADAVAKSPLYTFLKLVYYRIFAFVYSIVGSFAHIVMANSSWTKAHIDSLWKIKSAVVYPPCDTEAFKDFSLKDRERIVVSVSQFRPEKGHGLQLEAIAQLIKDHPEYRQAKKGEKANPKAVQLVMVGSARNASDEARIQQLKDKSIELGISDNVTFVVNAPFSELQAWLARSKVGIHAMLDEHFGIGVVEYMAAGLIPVAHNSAGPKMDIVRPYNNEPTGYLATTPKEFAVAIEKVLSTDDTTLIEMQRRARDSVQERFSEKVFGEQWRKSMHEALKRERITIFGHKMIDAPEGMEVRDSEGKHRME
ncbi:asparagine-linked glycosylation protein [Gryganskiella cystojenkinii]|nr:asparagine-linked glycosylation protein [Gryganskiella cystojenkinii]